MEERAFHPLDYVSVLRRRKWWFIVPVVVCILGGALLVMLLPKTYYSEAEIGVATPTLDPELLRGLQSLDQEERQRAISQQLLSRHVLERVAREENLSPAGEDVTGGLRSRIVVTVTQPIGRMENRKGPDSFKLGYTDSTPDRTQRITNRLATVFVEENSKTRTEQAQNTSEMLAGQLRASEQRLAQLESALRAKKEANMGRLPDQINANIQMVNGLRQQLESVSTQLRGEQDRLSMVESQMEQMRAGSAGAALTSTATSAIQTAQSRVNQLQQELIQARAMGYTDKHPEIVRIQHEMAQARDEMAAAKGQGQANSADVLAADPMYRQKVNERDAARLRVATLQRQASIITGQIAQYQSRVEAAPMVEQELASVQRDFDLEKARYADLKTKHDNALLNEDLARKQGGERFSVLYPAPRPTAPASPDQVRLMLLAVALGVVLGAVLVVGREFMDRSVHDVRALQSEFEVPVLGEIPRITV